MTTVVLAAAVLLPVYAQREETRRASMRSGGDHGKCTIEVNVDDVAEVYISGDTARLRTLSGQRAEWRRFECNSPMPPNPIDFRFSGIDGRGRQSLLRDPRQNGGVAVVRIEDRDGGREGYTFDIEWRSDGGYPGGGYPGGGFDRGPGRRDDAATPEAIAACQDAVRDRAYRELGFRDINFLNLGVDNGRGRRDFVSGTFEARRPGRDQYQFSCSVDLSTGRIRNVDLQRLSGGPGPGVGDVARACEQAVVDRLQGDGYSAITFRGTQVDGRRADYVIGAASARDRYGISNFDFSCAVGPRGDIRSLEVNRR